MSYSGSLEEFILKLKGEVFFLSPREKMFLKLLSEMGVPEEAVREGVERCYTAVDPRRRAKRPLFLCFREIMESYEIHMRRELQRKGIDWRRRFWEKVRLAGSFAGSEVREPSSEEEAQRILREIEARMVRSFWRRMDPSRRKRILQKFRDFRGNREIYRELIGAEVKRIHNLPDLSLYVD